MLSTDVKYIKSISEYHKSHNLYRPLHPLISVVNFKHIEKTYGNSSKVMFGFYCIALKKLFNGKMKYGQNDYDFDEGVLAFLAPNQIMSVELDTNQALKHSGWLLMVHPDFIWNTSLAKKIKTYDFFGYHINEALHLSEKEEKMLTRIYLDIKREYNANIDAFTQNVILSYIELLLNYSKRFYQRQFITRNKTHHSVLEKLETILNEHFSKKTNDNYNLPTVADISQKLHLSPNYLSRLLKTLTGKTTQEYIHEKLIEVAKEKLSTTQLSVNQIAYELGFEHSQSFGKLFKKKTELSPIEFRKSFTLN